MRVAFIAVRNDNGKPQLTSYCLTDLKNYMSTTKNSSTVTLNWKTFGTYLKADDIKYIVCNSSAATCKKLFDEQGVDYEGKQFVHYFNFLHLTELRQYSVAKFMYLYKYCMWSPSQIVSTPTFANAGMMSDLFCYYYTKGMRKNDLLSNYLRDILVSLSAIKFQVRSDVLHKTLSNLSELLSLLPEYDYIKSTVDNCLSLDLDDVTNFDLIGAAMYLLASSIKKSDNVDDIRISRGACDLINTRNETLKSFVNVPDYLWINRAHCFCTMVLYPNLYSYVKRELQGQTDTAINACYKALLKSGITTVEELRSNSIGEAIRSVKSSYVDLLKSLKQNVSDL